MRRIIVLGAALAMMIWLSYLRLDVDLGTRDPLTLAAIGFTILAAYSIGELGTLIGLPKVTGYILAGILLGPQMAALLNPLFQAHAGWWMEQIGVTPQVGAILERRVVGDMGMFKNLALGLIATTAGLELDIKAIRAVWKSLASTVALKIPLLLVLVGGTTFAIQSFYPFFPQLETTEANVAFAMVLAILGIGTSPAIALAVVSDSRSKGRLTDILLGIAVVKDLVVVVSLAVGIAIANSLLTPGAGLDPQSFIHLGQELLFSIMTGIVVGGILIAYVRFVHQEMLLFVLVMVLLVIEVSSLLHLELLLVFIVAGFLVRNFSEYEHELLGPLEQVSLPIFVVFFTVAGAEVKLDTTWTILPMALALVVARALAFWIASNLGARFGGETEAVRKNAWLTYLPQAGVTLGLVFIARDKIPALAAPITEMGMALVALHLLIGPITTGLGLKAAGETGRAGSGADPHGAHVPAPAADAAPQGAGPAPTPGAPVAVAAEAPPLLSPMAIAAPVTHPEVADVVESLAVRLFERVAEFSAQTVAPTAQAQLDILGEILQDEPSPARRLRAISKALSPLKDERGPIVTLGAWPGCGAALYRSLAEVIQSLPLRISVGQDAATLYGTPEEGLRLRGAKAVNLMAFRVGLKKQRHLSLRLAGRVACEPVLAEGARSAEASWYRTQGQILEILEDVVSDGVEPKAAYAQARRLLGRWQTELELDLRRGIQQGLMDLAGSVALLGTPAMPNSNLRYSTVEPRVHASLRRLEREERLWPQRLTSAEENLQASVQIELSALKVHGALKERGHEPLDQMYKTFAPLIDDLSLRVQSLQERAAEGDILEEDAIERLSEGARRTYTRSDQILLRRARSRFRRSAQTNRLIADLTVLTQALPKTLGLIAERTPLSTAPRPEAVAHWRIPLAEQVETTFFEQLVPGFAQALGRVSELIATSHGRLEACMQPASYALELANRGALDDDAKRTEAIREALERSSQRFIDLRAELDAQVKEGHESLETLFVATVEDLKADLRDDAQGASTRVEESVRATRRYARDLLGRGLDALRARRAAFGDAARRLGGKKSLQDLRIASGQEDLDAVGIRSYLDTWVTHPFDLPLPPVYTRLFSIKTVDDRRFLVAHRTQLREALEVIAAPRGTPYAGSVLVVGHHGSGRTSFLNSLQLRLGQSRVLRMDDTFASREEGIVAALAAELSTSPDPRAIVETLGERPTDVLIDNLERWVLPTPQGLEDLERLAQIMVEGSVQTRWVVTLESNALASLSPLVPLGRIFTHTAHLGPLSWEELAEVVDTRDRIGGFETLYNAQGRLSASRLLGREKEFYFRALAKVSEGNLRAALLAHLRALQVEESGALVAGRPAPLGLPFLSQLTAEALATLSLIARYGPMTPAELGLALLLEPGRINRTLSYLIAAELLESKGGGSGKVQVPPHVGPALFLGLGHAHVLLQKEGPQ